MKITAKKHLAWISVVGLILLVVLTLVFFPESFPADEGRRLQDAAVPYDVVIVFNSGGSGNTPLEKAADFSPVIYGMQDVLESLGYRTLAVTYNRTVPGISGFFTGIKEMLNGYQYSSQVQAKDIESLVAGFPEKQFIIAGLSDGGALTVHTLSEIGQRKNVCAVAAGIPHWYTIYDSPDSLVLNNNGGDTLAVGDRGAIVVTILKAPFKWIWAQLTRQDLSLAMSFRFPGHEYPWASPEVAPPITDFLKSQFPVRTQ